MNDTLRYMRHDPIHRKYHHDELTFSLIYAFHENFVLPLVARRSRPRQGLAVGSDARRPVAEIRQPAADATATCGATPARSCSSWGASSASGTSGITTTACNGTCCSGTRTSGLQRMVADLNRVYRREPALHQVDFDHTGFEWIDCHNYDDSVLSLLRRGQGSERLPARGLQLHAGRRGMAIGWACPNCAGTRKSSTAIRCSTAAATWATDRACMAEDVPSHGRPYSVRSMSPLAVTVLKPRR